MMPQTGSAHYRGRPSAGTKTGRVWDIADALSRRLGRRATHQEVRRQYVDEEGGEATTCMTTYYQWKASFDAHGGGGGGASGVAEEVAPFDPVTDLSGEGAAPLRVDPGVRLTVADNGRVVIPKDLRDAMALGADGAVMARLVDGELRLIAPRAAIARAQRRLAHLKKPGESIVDEFLAERRAQWGEE